MITRRDVLKISTAAAAGSLVSTLPVEAEQRQERAVAPSIQALKSLRDEVVPISNAERQQRIERARELMRANKIDAILMIGGTSLLYYTNIRWWNSERLGALVLPANGRAYFVAPAFERDRLHEQLAAGPLADSADVLTWQEDEDPYKLVASGLADRGIRAGTLGIEERTTFVFSDGVTKAAPAVKVVSATPVTAGCRMHKSAHELQLMKLANQATWQVYRAVYHALQPGMNQHDCEALIAAAYQRVGFRGDASVMVGEATANPHGSLAPQVIEEGTPIMIDDGCDVEGYKSDITRTFVLGKAGDEQKRVFDIVRRAQKAALAAARPGVPAESVDAAARKVIVDAGFGPGFKYFSHRLGHGIGMDGHEWPYLVPGNKMLLEKDMTFSDEPGIYQPGKFGVRIEDDMYVTENGAELFSPESPSIENPFGE
ncbi:MAG: M24 family metallopeptidase [Terriglobales bacterium]